MGFLDDLANGGAQSAPPPSGAVAGPGFLDSLVQGAPPPAPPEEQQAREMGWVPTLAATGARILIPLAGAAIGAPTGAGAIAGLGLGGMAGEYVGQAIERAAGARPEGFSGREILAEGALSAAAGPFSKIRKAAEAAPVIASLGRRVAPALTGAAEGAVFGAAGEQVGSLARTGEFASLGETALGAGVGAGLGAGIGAAAAGRPKARRDDPALMPPRPNAEFLEGRGFLAPDEAPPVFGRVAPGDPGDPDVRAMWQGVEFVPTSQLESLREWNRPVSRALLDDIRSNGIREPLVLRVTPDGEALLINGNNRLAAAQALGVAEIPLRVIQSGKLIRQKGALPGGQVGRVPGGLGREVRPSDLGFTGAPVERFEPTLKPTGPQGTSEVGSGFPARGEALFRQGRIDSDIGFSKSMVNPKTGETFVGNPGDDHADILGRLPIEAKDAYAMDLADANAAAKAAGASGTPPNPWHQYIDMEGRNTKGVPDAPNVPRDPYLRGQSAYTLAEALEVDAQTRERIRQAVPEVNTISSQTLRDVFDEILKNPASLKKGLGETGSAQAFLRLNRQVAEALDGRLIDAPQAEAILKQAGASYDSIRQAASAFGLGLNEFSRLRKSLDRAMVDGQQIAKKYGLTNVAGDLLRLRRSLLVTQLSTAVRNAFSQTARYGFEGIVQSLQGAMGSQQSSETASLLGRNFLRGNKSVMKDLDVANRAVPGVLNQLARAKQDYAGTKRKLFGLVTEEDVIKNANWMNLHLNQFVDDHIRAKSFDSFWRPALKARGLDAQAIFADPEGYVKSLKPGQKMALGEATDEAIFRAQEISFAEPAQNMVFQGLSDLVNRFPVFTLATPFPRFMASSMRFITRHNPSGLLSAFSQDVAGDPNKLREAYARAVAGTSMLAAGFAVREAIGAQKGTEVEMPGGENQILDLRSFYPLSFYVTLADMIDKMASGKKIGELPMEDIRESFFALGRFSDAVPNAVQLMIGRGDIQGFQANMEAIAGDFLGGFLVGGRTPKDFIDGLRGGGRSVDKKSTSQGRLFGGIAESVPFMAEMGDFPQVINPASGKDVAENKPVNFFGVSIPASIFRQVSGLNVRDRLPVESYLRSLDLDPYRAVGGLQVDKGQGMPGVEGAQTKERNLTRTLLGPLLAARLAPRIESLKKIKDPLAQKDAVRGILRDAAEDARRRAAILLRAQDPRTMLLIQGSKPDTGKKSRRERGRARRQLSTRFGIPNPDEELGY